MKDVVINDPFPPGDLVHGIMMDDFPSIYRQGIQPPTAIGREDCSSTPDEICFGMFARLPVSDRYSGTGHKAQFASPDCRSKAGIIVSRAKLIDRYKSGSLSAVGTAFQKNERQKTAHLYDFSTDGSRVFDVPVRSINEAHYRDQVRLQVDDLVNCGVIPDYWLAITVTEAGFGDLMKMAERHKIGIEVPVINPRGAVLYG